MDVYKEQQLVLDHIKRVWSCYPELRLGQLLVHSAQGRDMFYISDKTLMERMDEFDEMCQKRKEACKVSHD